MAGLGMGPDSVAVDVALEEGGIEVGNKEDDSYEDLSVPDEAEHGVPAVTPSKAVPPQMDDDWIYDSADKNKPQVPASSATPTHEHDADREDWVGNDSMSLPPRVPSTSSIPSALLELPPEVDVGKFDDEPAVDEPQLCIMGCGFCAKSGTDPHGFPYLTCCRGCAEQRCHDAGCQKVPGDVASAAAARQHRRDEELAYRLQLREARGASRERQRTRTKGQRRGSWDAVWGQVEFQVPREGESTWRHSAAVALFGICPCMMATFGIFSNEVQSGLSPAERRLAWKRLILSWSFVIAVLQTVILAELMFLFGTAPMSQNPMLGPHPYVFDALGAKNAALILKYNEWWRLLLPNMLHSGVLHLGSNLILQLRVGLSLEVCWGHSAYLLIYTISGAFGFLLSCVLMPNSLSVGSSAALCGLMGAWPVFIAITWNQTLPADIELRNTRMTLVTGAVVLMIPLSFLPLVDYASHIGGLVMGAALAAVIFANRLQSRRWRIASTVAGAVSSVVLVASSLWWFLTFTKTKEELLHLCPPMEVPFSRC